MSDELIPSSGFFTDVRGILPEPGRERRVIGRKQNGGNP
jgi:hypothetical protein